MNKIVSTNAVVAKALAMNAASGSPYYKVYASKANRCIGEIKNDSEGKLRELSGWAEEIAENAKKAGDVEGYNAIIRVQDMLDSALANYIRNSLRLL